MRACLLLSLFLLAACGLTTLRPKMEMSLAQAALIAAKKAQADQRSPNTYRNAEVLYIKAKSAYKRKYFNQAKAYADASRKLSERAEFNAKRAQALGENEDDL